MRLRCAAVAAALAASAAAGPSLAPAQDRTELPGVVRIAADGAGYVPVRLSRTLRLHDGERRGRVSVDLRGGRLLRGFLLRAEFKGGEGWPSDQAPFLNMMLSDPEGRAFTGDLGSWSPPLPPGDYRLYLFVAAGGPLHAELRFPDLPGADDLRITRGVEIASRAMSQRPAPAGRAAIGGRAEVGGGEWLVSVVRTFSFSSGRSGFVEICDASDGSTCSGGDATTVGRPASGDGGWIGGYTVHGPAEMDFGIWGSTTGGPPPALAGFVDRVGFDTPAPLVPQPPLGTPPPAVPPAGESPPELPPPAPATLVARPARAVAGRIAVRLRCAAARDCSGTVRAGRGASVPFVIAAGASGAVRVPLSRTDRRRLARRGRVRVRLTLDGGGRQSGRQVTVRRRPT